MKKFENTRTVTARPDEWIVVNRPGNSPDGSYIWIILIFVIGIWNITTIIEALAYSLLMVALIFGVIGAIIYINVKVSKIIYFDVRTKEWWKVGTASLVWLLISFWIFGGFKLLIFKEYTSYRSIEEGMLWWKRTITISTVDRFMVGLSFLLYWLSISLPLYAAISLAIQSIANRFCKTKSPQPYS